MEAIDRELRDDFLRQLAELRESGKSYEKMLELSRRRITALRVGNIYYRTYMAKDGALAVGCLSDRLRKRMLDVLKLKDIRFEPDYNVFSERAKIFGEELIKQAENIIGQKTVKEWLALFDEAGVPAGPVRFVEELIEDEQVVANGLLVELEHSLAGPIKMVGPLLNMSETPLTPRRASPALGEHSDEILKDLGYSKDDISRLRDEGITR